MKFGLVPGWTPGFGSNVAPRNQNIGAPGCFVTGSRRWVRSGSIRSISAVCSDGIAPLSDEDSPRVQMVVVHSTGLKHIGHLSRLSAVLDAGLHPIWSAKTSNFIAFDVATYSGGRIVRSNDTASRMLSDLRTKTSIGLLCLTFDGQAPGYLLS